jgi:hypothetical protein
LRGVYLGLTPACDGSSAHILQQTNSLPSVSSEGGADGAEAPEARPASRFSSYLLLILSLIFLDPYLLQCLLQERVGKEERERWKKIKSNVAVWSMPSLKVWPENSGDNLCISFIYFMCGPI